MEAWFRDSVHSLFSWPSLVLTVLLFVLALYCFWSGSDAVRVHRTGTGYAAGALIVLILLVAECWR